MQSCQFEGITSKKSFQHLVELTQRRPETVLRAKEDAYYLPGIPKDMLAEFVLYSNVRCLNITVDRKPLQILKSNGMLNGCSHLQPI